jgi:exodeoxyribonuclease VII small subunit
MPTKKSPEFNFEAALAELNQLVEKLEQGGLSLEQSLKDFERGIVLTRQCQDALKTAEQKVQILLGKNADSPLTTYDTLGDDE